MSANHPPHGMGSISKNILCCDLKKCPDLQRKVMLPNIHPCWDAGGGVMLQKDFLLGIEYNFQICRKKS